MKIKNKLIEILALGVIGVGLIGCSNKTQELHRPISCVINKDYQDVSKMDNIENRDLNLGTIMNTRIKGKNAVIDGDSLKIEGKTGKSYYFRMYGHSGYNLWSKIKEQPGLEIKLITQTIVGNKESSVTEALYDNNYYKLNSIGCTNLY